MSIITYMSLKEDTVYKFFIDNEDTLVYKTKAGFLLELGDFLLDVDIGEYDLGTHVRLKYKNHIIQNWFKQGGSTRCPFINKIKELKSYDYALKLELVRKEGVSLVKNGKIKLC